MRVVVVGAGAWGLPAGAELADRGHQVTVVDGFGPGNALASSSGPTRLWRLAHPLRLDVRLALRSVAAWRRLEEVAGRSLRHQSGLVWRDDDSAAVAAALAAEGVPHELLDPDDVGRRFPGLAPDGRPGVWQPAAGPLLAALALAVQGERLAAAGGELLVGRWVTDVDVGPQGVRLALAEAAATSPGRPGASVGALAADAVVLAPGPYAAELLATVGLRLTLTPVLEQVTYVGGSPGWETLPCLVDGPTPDRASFVYAMPTEGLGYKIGMEEVPQRAWVEGSPDRQPRPAADAVAVAYARDGLGFPAPVAASSTVCSWTHAPDDRFVVDRVGDLPVVVACGDSGRGFKFSALMGGWLADLVEDRPLDDDLRAYGLARLR